MNPDKDQIAGLLKKVIDPELAINIIDLGLVYDINLDEQAQKVAVNMTLTSPGCPLGEVIIEEAITFWQEIFPLTKWTST